MLETRKAYEYALDRIGLDLHSAGLWQEYINYLQQPRPNTPAYRALWTSTAAPGQEEAQRVMTLRFCLRTPLQSCRTVLKRVSSKGLHCLHVDSQL